VGVPVTVDVINVGDPSTRLVSGMVGIDHAVEIQSFAFDNVNNLVYVAQVAGACSISYDQSTSWKTASGSYPVSASLSMAMADNEAAGNLAITQLPMSGAPPNPPHSMFLLGFGHGVAIGVEPQASQTYIWVECQSQPPANGDGFGNKVARVPFTPGAVFQASSSDLELYDPITIQNGYITGYSCALDTQNGLLALRYTENVYNQDPPPDVISTKYVSAYSWSSTDGPDFSAALATIQQPPVIEATDLDVFQGWTLYGSWVYMLDWDKSTSPYTIYTTSIDINGDDNPNGGGTYHLRTSSSADVDADPREPEGMAIYLIPTSPTLCFGITNDTIEYGITFHTLDMYGKV